jgi:hypothetical protein
MKVVARLKRWLASGPRRESAISYLVTCPAGHAVRGLRQRTHQVVCCGECDRAVFILPRSAWPSIERITKPHRELASPWRRPLIAALLTVVLMAGALVVLFHMLRPRAAIPDSVADHKQAGEQALREGRMRRAVEEFDAAQHLVSQNPSSLPLAEARALRRLQRQAHLLADLLTEPLGEILLHAARSQEDEWQAQFQQRYKGPDKANAVVFAMEVRRDGAGGYTHDWHLHAGDEPARLEIGDLTLLRDLPLEQPRLLLFGARLGKLAREQNGVWMVRFEPDSGVLLTDLEVARACCPPAMYDELQALLDQQRLWIEGK